MGGGGGQSKIGQEADRALAEISMRLYEQTKGLRAETLQQITEGITTGNIAARLPEIQTGVESSMVQDANEQRQLSEASASAGQARTPFAIKQAADARLAAASRTALVPSDYIQAIIRTGEPIIYGQAPGIAISGLGGLADVASAERVASITNQGNLIAGLTSAAGQTVGSLGSYYAGSKSVAGGGVTPPTSTGESIYV